MRVTSSWVEVKKEWARLGNIEFRATRNLNKVLTKGFALTTGAVHVKSGALKASGTKGSVYVGDKWFGEIKYGSGADLGVSAPVTYAIYEKARDQSHDFFSPLKALHHDYVEAILKSL